MRRGILPVVAFLLAGCTSDVQPATTTVDTAATTTSPSATTTLDSLPSDQPELIGRLPDGSQYVLDLDSAVGEISPEGVYAAIEIIMDEAPFAGDDIGCPTCSQPVLGITTFYPGSGQDQGYDAGVYRASSGDWTLQIEVYEDILEAWGGNELEVARSWNTFCRSIWKLAYRLSNSPDRSNGLKTLTYPISWRFSIRGSSSAVAAMSRASPAHNPVPFKSSLYSRTIGAQIGPSESPTRGS